MEIRALRMMCVSLFAWGLLWTKMSQLKVGSAIRTEASSNSGPLPLDFTHDFRCEIGTLQWKRRHVWIWAVSLARRSPGQRPKRVAESCSSWQLLHGAAVLPACPDPHLQLWLCWLACPVVYLCQFRASKRVWLRAHSINQPHICALWSNVKSSRTSLWNVLKQRC